MSLSLIWPSTRTFSSRPALSKSQAHSPPWVGRRRLMQACAVESCGVSGGARFAKYDFAPMTAKRTSGPMRTAMHIFRDLFAQAYARIEALGGDIGQAVVDDDRLHCYSLCRCVCGARRSAAPQGPAP